MKIQKLDRRKLQDYKKAVKMEFYTDQSVCVQVYEVSVLVIEATVVGVNT